jgi:outer membrane biosynthesis protein TonB
MARVEGAVSFKAEIDTNGVATNLTFESGHPLLRRAVKEAVSGWRFPADAIRNEVQATIEFALNCPKPTEKR